MTTTLYKKNFTRQRRSEPPMFWVAPLLASVVLHAVAFFSIRLGAVSSVDTVQKEPISVELIEISPIVKSPEPVSAGASKITKAISPNSVLVPEPSKTVSPTLGNTKLLSQIKSSQRTAKAQSEKKESVSRVKISISRAVAPKKRAIAQVKATHSQPSVSSRSISKSKVSAKSIKPAPKPIVTVKPVVVRSPSIKPAPKPNVTVKPVAVRSPTPKPTASVKPTQKRSQPVRAIPYPTPLAKKRVGSASRRHRQPLPPTPQPPKNQHSSGIVATFDLGSIRSGDRDIPDRLAVPKQNQRLFPSVLDPLQLRLSQGSALILQVLVEIDERGKLTAIKQVNAVEDSNKPQPTAKTTDDLAFAKQLLKDWEFHPAYSGGQAVYSELWLRLIVKAR